MQTPIQVQLAHEIAERLDDNDAIPLYLTFVQQVPHEKLRELMDKVCSIPEREIKRTRGALFTFLVGQYLKYNNGRARY
jgi:hypothetical protein